jgi:hypothetical protein
MTSLRNAGRVLESDADIEAHIQNRAQFLFAEFLPYLRRDVVHAARATHSPPEPAQGFWHVAQGL